MTTNSRVLLGGQLCPVLLDDALLLHMQLQIVAVLHAQAVLPATVCSAQACTRSCLASTPMACSVVNCIKLTACCALQAHTCCPPLPRPLKEALQAGTSSKCCLVLPAGPQHALTRSPHVLSDAGL